MDSSLLQAYKDARYQINDPHIFFGIGNVPEQLRMYLARWWWKSFGFITAHNPYSKQLSPAENKERNVLLEQDLVWYTYMLWAGWDALWQRTPEDSFFVCNIQKDVAIGLARKYQQNALLYWDGQEIELVVV